MVATFCLRLAFGMIAPLMLLDPKPIPPRFFRVQFLVALSLLGVAGYFLFPSHLQEPVGQILLAAACVGFLCSIIWHTEEAHGGRIGNYLASAVLGFLLVLATPRIDLSPQIGGPIDLWRLADNFASALLVGTATTAMLLGHSYLISPAMTIAPLKRILMAIFALLAFRITLAIWGLLLWTSEHPLGNVETETLLWLSARWLLGIFAPLGLTWMAWETVRIRSTQSATGILYVVVIVVFLGELTSLLLLEKTGSVL